MGQICCPETSTRNYQFSIRNISEEENRNSVPNSIDVSGQLSHFRGPRKWDLYVVPKRRCGITNLHYVISQKRADLTYITSEA